MSHLRSLRDELFKYRKRKNRSIDGSAPGMPYERYRRFTTSQLSSRLSGPRGHRHEDYLGVIPTQYRPNMFSPAVDWDEYQQDHDEFSPVLKTPQAHRFLDEVLPENPRPVASSDEMSLTEQWLMNMGARPRPQEGPIPVDFEEIRHLLQGVHVPLHEIDKSVEIDSGDTISLDAVSTSLHAMRNHEVIDSELAIPLEDGLLNTSEDEEDHMFPDLGQVTELLWSLEDRLPVNHPDIMNLKREILKQGRQELLQMQQDPEFLDVYNSIDDDRQSNLGSGDPYINDDQIEPVIEEPVPEYADSVIMQDDYMVQERQFLPHYEESVIQDVQEFQQPVFADEMNENIGFQEPMLEEIVEQEYMALDAQQPDMGMPMAEAAPGPEVGYADQGQPEQFMGLEVFDTNPAFDEINQAIDQAAAFDQPEMDPWKQQHDAYQQMGQMMDMQMQYMANPFQMPEQMGPGYGPMPGPMQ